MEDEKGQWPDSMRVKTVPKLLYTVRALCDAYSLQGVLPSMPALPLRQPCRSLQSKIKQEKGNAKNVTFPMLDGD